MTAESSIYNTLYFKINKPIVMVLNCLVNGRKFKCVFNVFVNVICCNFRTYLFYPWPLLFADFWWHNHLNEEPQLSRQDPFFITWRTVSVYCGSGFSHSDFSYTAYYVDTMLVSFKLLLSVVGIPAHGRFGKLGGQGYLSVSKNVGHFHLFSWIWDYQ